MSHKLRFAVFGTGFWSQYQIPGWLETDEVELVALYNRTPAKAEEISKRFGNPRVYEDPEALLRSEEVDFVDIITDVDTHVALAELAARYGRDIVCQKPLAPSYESALQLKKTAKQAGVKLFVNENFRWQAPIRAIRDILDSGVIGPVHKARVSFCSAFPVFDNQPFLKELDRFIITDVGSHILDTCRFLLGEARSLRCLVKRVNPEIKGEDVANIFMEMKSGAHCYAEMSYASLLEHEVFPQTLIRLEGSKGTIDLCKDYEIRVTTKNGTAKQWIEPPKYDWADPEYAIAHASIVDTQKNILRGLKGGSAETTCEDNIETVKLVWASYASAENDVLVHLDNFGNH